MADTAQIGSLILPFLSAFRKNGPDLSGMSSEAEVPAAPEPQPDFSMFQTQAPPTPPPNPVQDLTQSMQPTGTPKLAGETKGHKLLRILMGAGLGAASGAGQMTFGGGFQQATGTAQNRQLFPQQLERGALQNEQLRQTLPFLRAQQFASLGKTQAETQKMNAEVQGMPIKQALEQAQAEAANYKDDPNLGLIDLRTRQPVNPAGFAPLTADEAQVLGKQPGEKVPLKLKNTANEIVQRGLSPVAGTNDTFIVNKGTKEKTPLNIGSPRAMFAPENRIIEVANPDKPGETMFVKAGTAVKEGIAGKASASVAVPKNVLKWATTGEGGKMAGAFNTAIAHAELLEKAITALDSGDVRTLNSIKNSFKKEFGSSDITNLQVISNAYAREITKMLSSGHMTNSEIDSAEATLPTNASPEQMLDAIHSYKALAGSKMVILHDQFVKGMQGKPNFPEQQPEEKKNPFRK